MAIRYVDPIYGKDRLAGTNCTASNPSGSTVLIEYPYPQKHDLDTGDQVVLSGFTAYLNGTRTITVVDEYSFTLDGISWLTTSDPIGNCTPVIGSPAGTSWATATRSAKALGSLSAGDEIYIAKTPEPISIGNVTWTNGSKDIVMATPLTKEIEPCVSGWTAAPGVTVGTNTNRKLGATSLSITALTVTGKLAYKTLSSTLDLSAYTKISFWLALNQGNARYFRDAKFQIRLCSDANGDVPVNIIDIPKHLNIAAGVNNYTPIEIDYGGALGSNINSIAIYRTGTNSTGLILLFNNLFATNSISLCTLIGKELGQAKEWYAINSIVNDTLTLDLFSLAATGSTYKDTTETVESYIRTMAFGLMPTTSEANVLTIDDGAGDDFASYIKYKGGINKATDIQDGETWYHGYSHSNYGIQILHHNCYFERLGFVRMSTGLYVPQSTDYFGIFRYCTVVSSDYGYRGGRNSQFKDSMLLNNSTYSIFLQTKYTYCENILIKNCGLGSSASAIRSDSNTGMHYLKNITIKNSNGFLTGYGGFTLINMSVETSVGTFNIMGGGNYFVNVNVLDVMQGTTYFGEPSTFINCNMITVPMTGFCGGRVKMLNWGGIVGNNYYVEAHNQNYLKFYKDYYFNDVLGYWEVFYEHTGLYETKLRRHYYDIGQVRVTANTLTTISLWVRKRADINNTDAVGYALLLRQDNNYAVIDNDVIQEIPTQTMIMNGDENFPNYMISEWYQVSLTFTPERTGVVLVELQCYQDKFHFLQFSSLSVTP